MIIQIKKNIKWLFLFFFPMILFSIPVSSLRAPWYPFVSGDGFRAHCDHIFDEENQFIDPLNVKPYDVIFLKTDYLFNFFSEIHPRILCKYILVTHNSDYSAPGDFFEFLEEEKIVAWFAQNVDSYHKKLHPIPIGIANRMWEHGTGSVIEKVQKLEISKKPFLYLNFSIGTYPKERKFIYDFLAKAPFSYSADSKNFENYLKEVASCRFVAAPRGNGLDTHRLWESLYLGSYPIVKTSTLDSLYDQLPVIIVEDWNQVTENFLREKALEMSNKEFDLERIKMSYWTDLIDSYKLKSAG